jgi:hypothetical protein
MKLIHSAAVLSVLFPALAMAEEAKKEEKSVVPYGIIQSKYYLTDSARDAGPEALTEIVRFGLRGKHGIARAGLEAHLVGNATNQDTGAAGTSGTTLVRAAWLGLELPTDTTIKIGRVRPGSASGYGTDASWIPQGYGGVDGARVSQSLTIGSLKIDTGLGVFNSLRSMAYATEFLGSKGTKGTMADTSWNKSEKAYIGNAVIAFDKFKAQLWYGFEKYGIIGASYKVTQAGNTGTDLSDKSELQGLTVADLTHIEASLGYDEENWQAGAFLEQNVIGENKSATANKDLGKLTVGASTGTKKKSVTVYGVGANLCSKQFDVANLIAKDDSLNFGASATTTQIREDGLSEASQKKNDQMDLSASASYTINGLDIALVYAHNTSAKKNNTDSDGEPVHAKQTTYINAVWEF